MHLLCVHELQQAAREGDSRQAEQPVGQLDTGLLQTPKGGCKSKGHACAWQGGRQGVYWVCVWGGGVLRVVDTIALHCTVCRAA
jgi:hypothetical protein